ncbi:MAG: hypothetical protein GVY08_06370 [Bacteroidetes bacterium]|jgi:putative restriction endonuclease|nr:hypothetical protein [Bacteroidota bacterium]
MAERSGEIKPLLNLRADRSHGWDERTKGQAPHKPFLLLSILDRIEQSAIQDHRIELTQELTDTFFTYWNAIMGENKITTIALPFYHMQSEPFWELRYREGKKAYKSSPSLGGLLDRVAFAMIEPALFDKMNQSAEREKIRLLLVKHYFSTTAAEKVMEIGSFNLHAWDYSEEVLDMAAEPFVPYQSDHEKRKLVQRDEQVREAGFSTTVRKNYKYHCAVCRNKLVTPGGQTLVEGAHIIPWSESSNDDPRNGLSLCRTHHWMFDNMMLTVRDDYSVRLSYWVERNGNEMEETVRLKNSEILLPDDSRYYPSPEALRDHTDRFETFHEKN